MAVGIEAKATGGALILLLLAPILLWGCGGESDEEPGSADTMVARATPPDTLVVPPQAEEAAAVPEIEDEPEEEEEDDRPPLVLPRLPDPLRRPAAPAVEMVDLNGRRFSLADHKGEVVLLVFWATWCRPCKIEIPTLVHLQETYADSGLAVLGVSVDQTGLKAVKPFVRGRKEINYTIVPNGRRPAQSFGGIRSIPTNFVIDRQGRVVQKIRGVMPERELEALIVATLREG